MTVMEQRLGHLGIVVEIRKRKITPALRILIVKQKSSRESYDRQAKEAWTDRRAAALADIGVAQEGQQGSP